MLDWQGAWAVANEGRDAYDSERACGLFRRDAGRRGAALLESPIVEVSKETSNENAVVSSYRDDVAHLREAFLDKL